MFSEISTNLLPESELKEFEFEKRYKIVINSIILAFVIVGAIAIFLLVIQYITSSRLNSIKKDVIATEQKDTSESTKKLEEDLTNLNEIIDIISKEQRSQIAWTPLLDKLVKTIPDGIKLNTLNCDYDTAKVSMTGNAPSRDALINFKTKLEESDFAKNVDVPLSSLVEKENPKFELSFTVEKEKLKP